MGRLGEVGDIAPVVGFHCTDAAEWVNGQDLLGSIELGCKTTATGLVALDEHRRRTVLFGEDEQVVEVAVDDKVPLSRLPARMRPRG
ncbi:hypothetical protein E2562_022278 [Oryza meyeriana var. granulata]|uniref:Uncharacterized protein n=1 Tax=Oryza meyeriana var. granulata TaxID=110450 RepID=A0A6G1D6U4_9ORYZ|nr:hypothetical protein E2562_022278 [Oryza meyeriana var. granulata]